MTDRTAKSDKEDTHAPAATEQGMLTPLLLRAAGAAELCNTSTRTWRTWNVQGKIPQPVYVGRIPFWRYDELQAWAAAGCPDRVTWEAIRN